MYAPRYRELWLQKIEHPGVRRRAELLYQQLDMPMPQQRLLLIAKALPDVALTASDEHVAQFATRVGYTSPASVSATFAIHAVLLSVLLWLALHAPPLVPSNCDGKIQLNPAAGSAKPNTTVRRHVPRKVIRTFPVKKERLGVIPYANSRIRRISIRVELHNILPLVSCRRLWK